ncbi:MAG: tetratricopeptide repeat protein [Candidatus Tectomicrobia bacterium]|uniref:Tetratricopeptide repeat protein n=1 Tax=Tectimicrobiota bacterium TaxID=2528274 RepID=A0A932FY37_UNCTE|nr:tetratricopeptide repeat protein [Candidatus Tectomicrobia bacterium]
MEYLTVLATGLPPARYGMRAFNVHNLVFLLGQLSARAGQDPYGRVLERPVAGPGGLSREEVRRRGRFLMAQAFHGGSLARLIGWLNRQEPSLGERLLGEPFAAEDGLESFRLVLALEEGLKARGYGLQEWPQAELLLANFGFISLPPELYPSTLAFCEKALQTRPESVLVPHLWIVVGNLYRKQGIALKAKESYEKALAGLGEGRFPRELVQLELVGSYRSLGMLSEALAVLEELCHSRQSFLRAKACFLRVEIYAQQGRYAQALEELYRLRSQPLGPDGSWYLASSYLEAARLLLRQKSYPEALKELSEGIRRFPNAVMAVEARLRMGEVYEEMRRYQQARDTYLGLIQERPQFHWANQARFRLAHLYLKVYQDRQAALRYFREVIRQAPLSKEAESSRKICQELESQPKTSRNFLGEIASSLLG